jgi:glucosamine 6-phosphate synthetase-like amidotransferase/phosphosugar isomerase protein
MTSTLLPRQACLTLLPHFAPTRRGFNVDQPRNLAKSVTVTEE